MKTFIFLFVFVVLSSPAFAADEAKGFFVFKIERFDSTTKSNVEHSFKIPLTKEFLSNFKNVPNQNSSGTGFYCNGGISGTRFMWWIRKTTDGRWSINMWGNGFELVNGKQISSRDPSVTDCVTIKKLEDLDMSYNLSYVNINDSIGVSFEAKYVAAKDFQADKPIPTAPVKKADHSEIFKNDDSKSFPLDIRCGFQEG